MSPVNGRAGGKRTPSPTGPALGVRSGHCRLSARATPAATVVARIQPSAIRA
ncbi:hypothetical protein [Streptomyces sp. AD681]|uniref:hypothetical protein n=1 Tax=Streptomyces sp. AD681 TaxID=3019069 RepID=UPI003FA789B2